MHVLLLHNVEGDSDRKVCALYTRTLIYVLNNINSLYGLKQWGVGVLQIHTHS